MRIKGFNLKKPIVRCVVALNEFQPLGECDVLRLKLFANHVLPIDPILSAKVSRKSQQESEITVYARKKEE